MKETVLFQIRSDSLEKRIKTRKNSNVKLSEPDLVSKFM